MSNILSDTLYDICAAAVGGIAAMGYNLGAAIVQDVNTTARSISTPILDKAYETLFTGESTPFGTLLHDIFSVPTTAIYDISNVVLDAFSALGQLWSDIAQTGKGIKAAFVTTIQIIPNILSASLNLGYSAYKIAYNTLTTLANATQGVYKIAYSAAIVGYSAINKIADIAITITNNMLEFAHSDADIKIPETIADNCDSICTEANFINISQVCELHHL